MSLCCPVSGSARNSPWCVHGSISAFVSGVGAAVGGSVGLRRQADGEKKGYVCAVSTDLKYSFYFVYIDRPSQTNVSWPPFLNCLFILEETCTGGSQGCYTDPNVFRLWLICGVWRGRCSAPPPFGEGWGGGKGFGLDCHKWYHLLGIKGFHGSNMFSFPSPYHWRRLRCSLMVESYGVVTIFSCYLWQASERELKLGLGLTQIKVKTTHSDVERASSVVKL